MENPLRSSSNFLLARLHPRVWKSVVFQQFVVIFLLAFLLGWVKSGFGSTIGTRPGSLLYWLGALLFTWSMYSFCTLLLGYLATFAPQRVRIFNVFYILCGPILSLFFGREIFFYYVQLFGDGVPPPPYFTGEGFMDGIVNILQHIYANAMFITFWLVMNYMAWNQTLKLIGASKGSGAASIKHFLLLRGYWLFDHSIKPIEISESESERNLLREEKRNGKFLDSEILRKNIFALNAQDHYVEVIHADGKELIHARFADAIADLEGCINGFQSHRSWWVCSTHVIEKSSGKLRWLKLENGLQVPVSRTFSITAMQMLRDQI